VLTRYGLMISMGVVSRPWPSAAHEIP